MRSLYWCQALHIMNKDRYQSTSARRALALLNSPQVQYYAAMYYNHSSMRKEHQAKSHVVYVYWIGTVYVQNNLPSELSKRTDFII